MCSLTVYEEFLLCIFLTKYGFYLGFGKNLDVHRDFVAFLEREFAGYYLPQAYGWPSTLNAIWSSGRRLIIGYDNRRIVSDYESLWPCVTHQWGNVRTIEELFNYLNRIETESQGYVRFM